MPELPSIEDLNKGLESDLPSISDLNKELKKKDSTKSSEKLEVSESETPSTLPKIDIAGDVGVQSGETTTSNKQGVKQFETVADVKARGEKPTFTNYIASTAEAVGNTVTAPVRQISEGIEEGVKGAELLSTSTPKKTTIKGQMEDMAMGALDELKGAASIAFGLASATPAGAAFNLATEAIPEKAKEVLFAPASSIAKAFGYEPQKHEGTLEEKALSIGDIALSILEMGILHKGGAKGYETIKEKIKNNKSLTPEESIQVNEVVQNATPDEVSQAIENTGKVDPKFNKENKVVDIVEKSKEGQPVSEEIASLEVPKETFNKVVDTAIEANHITQEQANSLKAEHEAIEEAKGKVPDEYKSNPKIIRLVSEKTALEKSKEGVDESFHPDIDKKIDDIKIKINEEVNKKAETETSEPEALRVLEDEELKKAQTKTTESEIPKRVLQGENVEVNEGSSVKEINPKESIKIPDDELVHTETFTKALDTSPEGKMRMSERNKMFEEKFGEEAPKAKHIFNNFEDIISRLKESAKEGKLEFKTNC